MKHTKAFTMIELVFVIVILGVVSSVGATIIAQLFENYITQRATHRVGLKTELAINQIANRLSYRINDTVIAKRPDNNTFLPLRDVNIGITNKNNIILEWIGYDNDSFSAAAQPGWSGYCDTATTNDDGILGHIATPYSNLAFTQTVISNLNGGANQQWALLFNLQGGVFDDAVDHSDTSCYGYNGNTTCIHNVGQQNNTTLWDSTMPASNNTRITDQYKLAWTAYALVPVDDAGDLIDVGGSTDFNLQLRYGYQPWNNLQYDNNVSQSIIARHVTAFKFLEQGGTLRIKLCMTENTGDAVNVSVCKEKVVMR